LGLCNHWTTRQEDAVGEDPGGDPIADCKKTRQLCRLPQLNNSIENNGR